MDLEGQGTGEIEKRTNQRVFTTEVTEDTEVKAGSGREGVGDGARGDEGVGRRAGKGDGKLGIGLVGPMSNYAAPPQLVEDVPYRDLEEMKAFAVRWRDEHRGTWFTVPKLSGFCLLMKRAVYDAIGGLDERFGLGFFDDDDVEVHDRIAAVIECPRLRAIFIRANRLDAGLSGGAAGGGAGIGLLKGLGLTSLVPG
jgi:hypothetical protein